MSAIPLAPSLAPVQETPDVFHEMSARDFGRLVEVALGKLADPRDWRVIIKAHAALDEQWNSGYRAGHKQGMIDALADAEAPMQDFIIRMQARPR